MKKINVITIDGPSASGKGAPASHRVVSAPRLVGLGRQPIFFENLFKHMFQTLAGSDGRCLRAARGAQAPSPKRHGEGRTVPGWSSSDSTALCPASTVHRKCKGHHAAAV